jgi:pterin-4a-carbinolamine dehydratase
VAKLHMQNTFNAANFSATQAAINAAAPEACAFCHGPGMVLDVQVVHGSQ